MEILAVKSGTGPTTMAFALDGTVKPGWPQSMGCEKCYEYGGYNQNIGAADLDGDGKPEVVATYDACLPRHPASGREAVRRRFLLRRTLGLERSHVP